MGLYLCTRGPNGVTIERDGKPFYADDFLEYPDGRRIRFDFGNESTGTLLFSWVLLRQHLAAEEALYRLGAFYHSHIAKLPSAKAAFTTEGILSWIKAAEAVVPFVPLREVLYRDRFVLTLGLNSANTPRRAEDVP